MGMDGFITGLATTLKEGVDQRRKKADEYYEKQLEIARTTGLRNMKESQGRVNTSVAFANKLTQKGVPKDIIMAVAQANPEGLSDFEETITKMELGKGDRLTEQEYRDLVKIKGEMVGKDKDLVTFFKDMHDPFIASTKDKEMHNYDPRGSILSRMFAVDEMDRADKRLESKVVAGGKTAAELLQYGDEYIAQPSTSVSVDFDPATVDTMTRAAAARKKALSGGGGFSVTEATSGQSLLKDMINDANHLMTVETQKAGGEIQTPEALKAIADKTYEEVLSRGAIDGIEKDNPDLAAYLRSELKHRIYTDNKIQTSAEEVAPEEQMEATAEEPKQAQPGKSYPVKLKGQLVNFIYLEPNEDGTHTFLNPSTGKRTKISNKFYTELMKNN